MKLQKTALVVLLVGIASGLFAQTRPGLQLQVSDNNTSLSVTGAVGTIYEIQSSDDLSPPMTWVPLTNFALPVNPTWFTQAVSSATPQRFFRAVIVITTNLVWIPPGSFVMGSPDNEQDRMDYESPRTMVTLTKGFYIGKYPVTQAEYLSLTATNPSYFLGDTGRPVEQVSWSDATNYCVKLTQRERQNGHLPPGWAYRLPTEAEWEYACRAGTTTRFSFGDDPSYAIIGSYAWYWDNSYETSLPLGVSWPFGNHYYTTNPVGTKLPNPWGLYDMQGNVWQWCHDWFGMYPGGAVTDPKGPAIGSWHSFRGGCWSTTAPFCRSASRGSGNAPSNFMGGVGFRTVLAAE